MLPVLRYLFLGLAALLALAPSGKAQEASATLEPLPPGQEEPLGVISAKAKVLVQTVAPEGRGIAWIEKSAGAQRVFLNGKQMGATFSRIDKLTLSDDGGHLLFAGKHGDWWHLIIDGEKSEHNYSQMAEIWLSKDGQRSVVVGFRESRWRVIVNGIEESPTYEKVESFAKDAPLSAFVGCRDGKDYPVVDGKEVALPCEAIFRMLFPPGKPPIFIVKRDGKQQILVGEDVKVESSHPIAVLAISHDGQRILYTRWNKDSSAWDIVSPDGSSIEGLDEVLAIGFLGNSEHWVAGVRKKGSCHYIVDGQWGPPATQLGPFLSTPDGLHSAYGAAVEKDVISKKYAEGFVVHDGEEIARTRGETFSSILNLRETKSMNPGVIGDLDARLHGIGSPRLSLDGRESAFFRYVSPLDNKIVFCRNGQCGDPYDDAANLIYTGPTGGCLYTVRNGKTISIMRNDATIKDIKVSSDFGYDFGTSFQTGLSKNVGLIAGPEGRRYILVIQQITIVPPASLYQPMLWRTIYVDGQAPIKIKAEYFARLEFSADEAHWAGLVMNMAADRKSCVLADGREGAHYDEIIPESFSVDGNNGIRFIARRGNQFFRVVQPWPMQAQASPALMRTRPRD